MHVKLESFPAYFALFKVTLRQLFWSRRALLILIGCVLPLVIALVLRLTARGAGTVNGFIPSVTFFLYGFVTNLCAIFYGSAIISDEIEGKGLTYLRMRPLRKSSILLSKFAAYLLGSIVLIGTSHLLLTGIMQTHPKLRERLLMLGLSFQYIGTLTLALLVYGAFAVLLSVRFKHPVLWGLLFVFGWERITSIPSIPIGIKRLSFSHYLITLFPDFKMGRRMLEDFLGDAPPPEWVAMLVLCLLIVGAMSLAIRIFQDREYSL